MGQFQQRAVGTRLIAESRLPTLTIDISDNDLPNALEQIADWLESTGGLYAKAEAPSEQI